MRWKRLKGKRRAVWAIVICTVLLIGAIELYFADYYPCGDEALRCLTSGEGVTVTENARWIAFDGPGTAAALAFYPGAKVAAEAYAPLMRRIAQLGVDACLLKPPRRIALLDIDGADRVVTEQPRERWYVGGHSLGGVAACMYAGRHPDRLSGVVLLAAYPTGKVPDALGLLSVRGSLDGVLNLSLYKKNRSNWPVNSREQVLKGGNHAGFGDYGPQKRDLSPTIPASEQWAETARLIAAFCLEGDASED